MTQKLMVKPEDVSVASLMSVVALAGELVRKGVLSNDESNLAFATAASMCKAQGSDGAAALIASVCPSSVGIDPVAAARARGDTIITKP